MINKKQIRIILSSILLSFIFIAGFSMNETANIENSRDLLIERINSSINEEIAPNSVFTIDNGTQKCAFSLVEYNPKSGIITNSTLKDGQIFESFEKINQ